MVSNMKKTLAGLALAALPMMASAQMDQMQDSALANVSGQLGIIDLTTIGYDANFGVVGRPLVRSALHGWRLDHRSARLHRPVRDRF